MHPTLAVTEATAELADGTLVEVHAAPTPEGYRWIVHGTPAGGWVSGTRVESTSIRSYTTVSHVGGMVEGLLLGGLGGVVVGGAVGLSRGDDTCPAESFCLFNFSAADKAVIGGIVLGGIGLVLGGLAGAVAGSRDVYRLDPGHMPRVSAAIEPGHAGATLSWSF